MPSHPERVRRQYESGGRRLTLEQLADVQASVNAANAARTIGHTHTWTPTEAGRVICPCGFSTTLREASYVK